MFSLENMVNLINEAMSKLGYVGLFFGTFLESFFVPIPSELLMGSAGFLIVNGRFNWPLTILVAVSGTAISSAIVWWLGHKFGREFLIKYGKYVGYDEEELEDAKVMFDKWGYYAIFGFQMVPVMRSVITIPAGVLKTKFWPFILCTTAGATIWLTGLTYLGTKLGENWPNVIELARPYEKPILLAVAIFFVYYVYHHFFVRPAHKRAKREARELEK
jgi:membrane protein DedA with SNARE-associated domain